MFFVETSWLQDPEGRAVTEISHAIGIALMRGDRAFVWNDNIMTGCPIFYPIPPTGTGGISTMPTLIVVAIPFNPAPCHTACAAQASIWKSACVTSFGLDVGEALATGLAVYIVGQAASPPVGASAAAAAATISAIFALASLYSCLGTVEALHRN